MATRLYFPASDAPAITPGFHADWTYTSEALRRRLAHVKGSSAITAGTQIGAWTPGQKALDRQYISTRMAAGVTFTISPGGSYKCNLMVREYATADNIDRLLVGVRVVSEDGNTVRAVLRVPLSSNPTEFINNATHRNQRCSTTFIGLATGYTTVLGDRLVVEIGYQDNSGTSPEASAKWGENATDLPENDTQTTDGAGWIEFTDNITFAGELSPQEVLPGVGILTLVGFSPSVVATNHKNVLADVGAATLNGFAPVVQVNTSVSPGTGQIVCEGFEPTVTVTANQNISAGVGEVSLAGLSPTVSVSDHKNVTPNKGDLSIVGFSPSVETPRMVVTDKGDLVLTGFEPTIGAGDNTEVTPGFGQLSFIGFEPVAETPVNINSALGQLILSGFSPTVNTTDNKVVEPGTGQLIFAGYSPSTGGSVSVQPEAGQITVVGYSPEFLTGVQVYSFYSYIRHSVTKGSGIDITIVGGSKILEVVEKQSSI
jgi:hypothetical protein